MGRAVLTVASIARAQRAGSRTAGQGPAHPDQEGSVFSQGQDSSSDFQHCAFVRLSQEGPETVWSHLPTQTLQGKAADMDGSHGAF